MPCERPQRALGSAARRRPADHDHELVVLVRRLLDDAANGLREQVDRPAVDGPEPAGGRDHEGDERRAAHPSLARDRARRAAGHHLGVEAAAAHVVLERQAARVERPRLGLRRARGRLRELAPVIEDARDVVDRRVAALHQAQEQVVVLRALVAGPEPADLARARVRRITIRWHVYMHDRKWSGDQSGLKYGSQRAPARSSLSSSE